MLNRSYLPVHITSVRRALSLLYQDIARAVDDRVPDVRLRQLVGAVARTTRRSGWSNAAIRVPRVDPAAVVRPHAAPARALQPLQRLSRAIRTGASTAARQLPRSELNLDHVVPRSQGGASVWENVVCSCHRCNRREGRPDARRGGHAARPREPFRPQWTPFMVEAFSQRRHEAGLPFLSGDGTRRTGTRSCWQE